MRTLGNNPPPTTPPDILNTSAWPDLVIIKEQCVTLVELTIPFNPRSLASAKTQKEKMRITSLC